MLKHTVIKVQPLRDLLLQVINFLFLNLPGFKSAYAYTVRSWLSRINSALYVENLTYGYSGNVATKEWLQDNVTRKYTYAYDELSRLKTANYNNPGTERFSAAYDYNKHGNITSLTRKGLKTSGSYSDIDVLSLNYGGSNQLKYVHDYGETVMLNTSCDFKNYSTGTNEYAYNASGSMTRDLNRGISEIAYNVLNLPAKVDVKSPVAEARNEYGYSADGQKLRVVQRWNPSYSTTPVIGSGVNAGSLRSSKTTDYVGNKVYKNGVLKRILTENGYYESGNYYFYIQNHLGSNVITINKNGSIVQSSHYYPFGLTMGISTGQGVQPYKYTGKELDMQHGLNLYDFSARTYDPAIGQFTTVDPLAEKYYPVSPYAYCSNNPINRIDPDGRWDVSVHVYRDRAEHGYGVAIVTDRVYRFNVRAEGANGHGRTRTGADTPLGTYDIPDSQPWISGGNRASYGPNARLNMVGESGEIIETGRTDIRIHGGRQESYNSETDTWAAVANPQLKKTYGCLRAYDTNMAAFKDITDNLQANDVLEVSGAVTMKSDLKKVIVPASNSNMVEVTIEYRIPEQTNNNWQLNWFNINNNYQW